MTDLLYHTNSYVQAFEGAVIALDTENRSVVLDRTAFYPGGGGQPADRGTLEANGTLYTISQVKKIGPDVHHFIEGDSLPAIGQSVVGQIDWDHRYTLMRTHTSMHILCGVVWRDYRAHATGSNMEPLRGRLDFEFDSMQQDLVREIEEKLNAEIAAAREIRVQILPRDEAFKIPDLIRTKINLLPEGITEVRTVEIVGLDLQADGGTHVHNTQEVGRLRVVDYKSKGKINKRIYFEVEN
jgi:misacylated tRNA(Ala) deacylase